jgi:dihydrofolate reductase
MVRPAGSRRHVRTDGGNPPAGRRGRRAPDRETDLRGYWPQQADDKTGITDYLNDVDKYVVSSTMTDTAWQNSTVLSGDPVENVRALKERTGNDIVLTGSITLTQALIAAGLVDEYRLFVYPVVQGRGRRLFPDGYEIPRLS